MPATSRFQSSAPPPPRTSYSLQQKWQRKPSFPPPTIRAPAGWRLFPIAPCNTLTPSWLAGDAWIIGTSLNQRVNIRAVNELETDAVETRTSPGILLQATQVAPNLRFKRTSAGLKNAHHFPNASANFQVRPQ